MPQKPCLQLACAERPLQNLKPYVFLVPLFLSVACSDFNGKAEPKNQVHPLHPVLPPPPSKCAIQQFLQHWGKTNPSTCLIMTAVAVALSKVSGLSCLVILFPVLKVFPLHLAATSLEIFTFLHSFLPQYAVPDFSNLLQVLHRELGSP